MTKAEARVLEAINDDAAVALGDPGLAEVARLLAEHVRACDEAG